jgi:hypothetical protein
MTAHRFLGVWNLHHVFAGVAVLLCAGLTPAAAQFAPPPGQTSSASQGTNPFPPPPGQQQQQRPANNPFPSPGQASVSPGGFGSPPPGGFGPPQGGFGSPSPGGFGGSPQGGGSFVRPGGFSQGGAGPAGGMGGGMGGAPGQVPEAQKICLDFPAIREDVEKGAAGIREAGERKLSREQVCPLFKTFAAKEEKLVKFLTTNQRLCGVPPNIVTQVKQNHAKTIQIRNTVCSAAPAGPAAVPTLSDALGGPIIADDTSAKSGRGTFDTLTGNALQR